MPVASRFALIAVLLLGSAVLACGGDDDDEEPTPTRTATASRVTRTPTPGADEKTPGAEETPVPTQGAGTAPPTAGQGTPAVEPPDRDAYLAQFLGADLGEEGCIYTPSTRLTDCGGRGIYSVSPPLAGQDISCFITIVGNNPEYIRCTSAEPAETKWYEIQ